MRVKHRVTDQHILLAEYKQKTTEMATQSVQWFLKAGVKVHCQLSVVNNNNNH